MTNTPEDFSQWRDALAGGKPGMHLDEPWCGYFAVQDRKSTVKAARWPLIAGAIWRDENGILKAERGGEVVPGDGPGGWFLSVQQYAGPEIHPTHWQRLPAERAA